MIIIICTDLEKIAKLASTFQLLVFAFVNVAVIVMRESGIKSYDPGFKSPFYPYTQIFGILVAVVLIPEMGFMASIFAMGLVGLGVTWHNLYVKHRVFRVGAVAKMAERIAERLLEHDAEAMGLNKELREILKEKGLRSDDPFVEMVNRATFIDIEKTSDCEEAIKEGSRILSQNSGISMNTTSQSFQKKIEP